MQKAITSLASAMAVAGALAGCDQIDAQSINVMIQFSEEGCPTGVSVEEIEAPRGQFIFWQAVDTEGQDLVQRFEIFFDPINASPLKAPVGKLRKRIDRDAPPGLYKYSVVGFSCPDDPLDPRIRVPL